MSSFIGRITVRVCVAAVRPLFVLIAFAGACSAPAHAQTLPSPWTGTNVGSAAPAGRATYSNGTFTLEGGGRRIDSTSDEFYFVHQPMTGDGTIVARVSAVEYTSRYAKAALMIRETLAANARHASVMVSAGGEIHFQRRRSTGGSAEHIGGAGSAPVWLRLVRSGSTITAARSSNGTSWSTIGSTTVTMASAVYVGLGVSSYNTSALASGVFTNVTAGTSGGGTGLPSGWSAADVGSPSLRGQTTWNGSAYTIQGAGTDIWNTSDQFQYLYRQVSGDVDVVARVASLDGPHAWSKAGVMIRPSLAANAANAYALVSSSRGISFQYRPGTGHTTSQGGAASGTAPVWLKLERRGSAITAFRSSNGTSWSMLSSTTLSLGSSFYVGVAVTSHDATRTATASVTNVYVGSPSSSGTPPTVSLTSPSSGATFTAPATVNLAASASDTDNGVAQVEFYANGTLLGADTTSPYAYTWSSVPAGSYTLTAVARDTGGLTTTSAARSISVSGGTSSNVPPTVSLTAPASGSTYTAPASVTISANAADSNGSVARVDFYANGTLIAGDTTSPYSVTWSTAPAGTYSLTAVARDNAGATTTSAARSITINAAAMPNRALFAASPDHATVTRYALDVFTAGANPATATPMATQNLGKPAVVNGECSADISTTISALPGGNYFATVVAISSGGTSTRATSAVFAR